MITEITLGGFQAVVKALLFLIPDIPSMPAPIQSSMDFIIGLITDMVGIVAYIYTPTVFVFIFVFLLAILGFDFIYKFVLWILHKVKG